MKKYLNHVLAHTGSGGGGQAQGSSSARRGRGRIGRVISEILRFMSCVQLEDEGA